VIPAGSSSDNPARMPGPSTAKNAAIRKRLTGTSADTVGGDGGGARGAPPYRGAATAGRPARPPARQPRKEVGNRPGIQPLELLAGRVEEEAAGRCARHMQTVDRQLLRPEPRRQPTEPQAAQHSCCPDLDARDLEKLAGTMQHDVADANDAASLEVDDLSVESASRNQVTSPASPSAVARIPSRDHRTSVASRRCVRTATTRQESPARTTPRSLSCSPTPSTATGMPKIVVARIEASTRAAVQVPQNVRYVPNVDGAGAANASRPGRSSNGRESTSSSVRNGSRLPAVAAARASSTLWLRGM